MRCPYCKSAVEPDTPSCHRCDLSLQKIAHLFGAPPKLAEGISDEAGVISRLSQRRIRSAARDLSIRFPQTAFSVITTNLPKDTSLGLFSFWIFNEAHIARELDRGWNNHDILLTIDPAHGRANLMVGYGLEPFISEDRLETIVATARPAFELGNFGAGIGHVIASLRKTLTQIVTGLQESHGLTPVVNSKVALTELAPAEF